MKYIVRIKRESSIGEHKRKYTSYIIFPYKSCEGYTQEIYNAYPFDNETEALDYISQNVIMYADVVEITEEDYKRYLEYQRGIKKW